MGARGPRSAAALATVSTITEARPPPPEHLTPEQAELWVVITNALPAGWFKKEAHALLAVYCQHVSTAQKLGKQIDAFQDPWLNEPEGFDRFSKLLKLRETETRAMAALATRMRITQQSRYMPTAAARMAEKHRDGWKPWDDPKKKPLWEIAG